MQGLGFRMNWAISALQRGKRGHKSYSLYVVVGLVDMVL